MNILLNAPVLVKILISLAVILAADSTFTTSHFQWPGNSCSCALSGHSLPDVFAITINTIFTADYVILIIMIFLLIWMSNQMKETMMMDDLVKSLQQRLSGKTLLAVVPAIIGLIPMPGALFSALLLMTATKKSFLTLTSRQKSTTGQAYVGILLPLYAGVILALQITGLEIWQLAVINFPLTVFSAMELLFPSEKSENNQAKRSAKKRLFLYIFCLNLNCCHIYVNLTFFPSVKSASRYLPMGLSIFITMSACSFSAPFCKKMVKDSFFKKHCRYGAGSCGNKHLRCICRGKAPGRNISDECDEG
jgi:hypothetical protein